jgi:RND family efflux transporter MFP subunit
VTNKRVRKHLLFLAAVSLAAASCSRNKNAPASQNAAILTVAVAKASTGNLAHHLVLTAEFTPFQEIDVMAKVSGYVKQINVDIGDRVSQGQLLAVLELPEMTDEVIKAKAAVQRSEAQVTQARDEVERVESNYQIAHLSYQRLFGVANTRPGLVAQQEVDDSQSKELSAQAMVQSAKSSLAAAIQQVSVSKAELARFETLFEYTKVTAPFMGVITKRYANTGSMIQAGTASQSQAMPLVRLSENTLLRLTLPVPESAVPTVHVGQAVDVRVPTLNRLFPGKVARFADTVQLSTRTMDTEVDVRNDNLILVPGMYAEVNLTLQTSNDAVYVPVSAVDQNSENGDGDSPGAGKGQVLVVTPGHQIERRSVTVGMETANRIEIRSGLRDGEMVVIGNRSGLQPGMLVDPKITAMTQKEGA